ncbi:mRNA capping nucleoside-triphosphatase,putative [Blumeria hordei DH14]|nr:mRNA capping nucleoside-triphosphatase,putative [Blumeria hordei DH14]
MRKRIRYSSPPVWARSVRGNDSHRAIQKNFSMHNETQPKQTVISVPNATFGAQITTDGVSNGPVTAAIQPTTPVVDAHPSLLLENWEESITGQRPTDHMSKVVGDFLFYNCVTRSDIGELSSLGVQIEIEAKFGELIDKETNQRYYLPVKSECVLAENSRVGFKSNLSEHHHQKLNNFLNHMVTSARPGSSVIKPRTKIDYLHRREVDQFYELPKAQYSILPAAIRERQSNYHSVKVRVSRDQKTGKVLAKIIKSRVADLHIYSAHSSTPDCRISINLEMPYQGDIDELKAAGDHRNQSPNRSKDRLSYSQSYYQIDLTQVTQVVSSNQTQRAEKDHELEVEISSEALMEQGQLAAAGKPNEYLPLVEGFLNNIRVLSRLVAENK